MSVIQPTTSAERLIVLDALRGFALFGILFANLYSFIGYNTFSPNEILALPIADKTVLFFIDWFVEGKFYGIFSILFGVGFALQAERFQSNEVSFYSYWFRRMVVLCFMGLLHMYCIWNGDILTLYSLLGMLLPLFLGLSNQILTRWIIALLIMPLVTYTTYYLHPDAHFWATIRDISTDLKVSWGYKELSLLEMRTSDSPIEVFSINVIKAIPRATSYLLTGRYFHVLGLFLIGLVLARQWLPRIRSNDISVPKGAIWFGVIGLICSFTYAYTKLVMGSGFETNNMGIIQVIAYNIGSTSLALGIAMTFLYWWASGRAMGILKNLAVLGRMALSNYIFQNITAIFLFFGYGFALMRKVPFSALPFFAFGILIVQWIISKIWLRYNKQGPLESIWKKLSYPNSRNTTDHKPYK